MPIVYQVKDGKKIETEGIPNSIGSLLVVVKDNFPGTAIEDFVFILKHKCDEYLIDQTSDIKQFYATIPMNAIVEYYMIDKQNIKPKYKVLNATSVFQKKNVETSKPLNYDFNWMQKVNDKVTERGNDKKFVEEMKNKYNNVVWEKETSNKVAKDKRDKHRQPFDFSAQEGGQDWANNEGEERIKNWCAKKCCKKGDEKRQNEKVRSYENEQVNQEENETFEEKENLISPKKQKPKNKETEIFAEKPIIQQKSSKNTKNINNQDSTIQEKQISTSDLPVEIRKILEENQRLKQENEKLRHKKNDNSFTEVPSNNNSEIIEESKKLK